MEMRVLGPVEARADGEPVPLGAVKQRGLLAMLVLRANRTVSADELMEGIWGEHPPASAPKLVQQHVSHLRRLLADSDGGTVEILTRGRGYELRIAPEDVDVQRFERLVDEGAGREALDLWHGPALVDVADVPFAAAEIRRLDELRLTALERAVETDLAEGRHREVVAELDALVREHPLSERLHGRLMLALYRSGRQADALEAYRRARTALVEEIGVEPGPELRRLHGAILRQDPGLAGPGAAELPEELETTAPLAGRGIELERLRVLWEQARRGRGLVAVITGPEGIGTTRLAAELAAEVHRQGARITYAAGAVAPPGPASPVVADAAETDATTQQPTRVVLDSVAGAATIRRPTLVVLDGVAAADAEGLSGLATAVAERPVLAVVTTRDAALAGRLPDAVRVALGPLDEAAVAAIAAQYAPGAAEVPAASLRERSGGVPRSVHRLAATWAREDTARRLQAAVDRTAAERGDLRRAEDDLAGNVVGAQAVRERVDPRSRRADLIVCPFKGLAPFESEDAEYFFGRERLVAELLARLVGSPLLGVIGPSGSGKSSVVRAGLLPQLAADVLPGSGRWAIVRLRPGEHPMRELEDAVRVRDGHPRLLIAVDQFEEAFTVCRDETERRTFVDALTAAAAHPRRRVTVVIALRADFYGRCAAYPVLARMLAAGQVLVGPMAHDELRRAIELPAWRAGLRVEPPLVDRLLADVEDEPGALPLLSTTLLELWQQRSGRELQLASYEQAGGVRGAVARLAEAGYARLELPQQAIARSMLLRLAGEDAGSGAVRRRVALDELDAGGDLDAARVLAVLADSRLVTVSEGAVEVAHEALLREWPRLRQWLDEDAEGRRLHHQLAAAAREWNAGGGDASVLYRGARLASTLDWAAGHDADLNALERDFLDASHAQSEGEARRTRRINRRLRTLLAATAALLAVAVLAAALFVDQRGNARALSRSDAATRVGAQALVEDDIGRSLLLGRQGWEIEDSVTTRGNLLGALLRSPAAIRVTRLGGPPVKALTLRHDARVLVTGDEGGVVRFLDSATLRAVRDPYRPGVEEVGGLAFSPDGRRLAIGGPGHLELMDGRSWRRIAVADVRDASVEHVAFSRDGRTLYAVSTYFGERPVPDTLLRFDGRSAEPLAAPADVAPPGALWDLVPSPDGRSVITVVAAPDGRTADVVVRDARTLRVDGRVRGGYNVILAPDAKRFAVGDVDGTMEFVDLRDGRRRAAAGRHATRVVFGVFTRDGRFLLSTGDDGDMIVWDAANAAAAETFAGHSSRVRALELDRRGTTLFSSSLDGTLVAWDLVGDRRLGRPFDAGDGTFGGEYPGTTLSADGRRLVTREDPGGVSVIDTATLTQRTVRPRGLRSQKLHPAFGPPGTLVVAGDRDGELAFVDDRTGRVTARLRGHRDLVFMPTVSLDGRVLATTGLDRTLRLWSLPSGRPLRLPIRLDSQPTSDVGIAPDRRTVAVSMELGTVDVYDVRSSRRIARLPLGRPYTQNPTFSHFSRDGRLLVAGTADGRVRIYSTDGWKPVGPAFAAAPNQISSLDVSRDGRTLLTASVPGEVRLWDVGTRRPIGPPLPLAAVESAGRPFNVVAWFSPDGQQVYAVHTDGRGYRWDVRPSAWGRHACSVAGRQLTRAEWAVALPGRGYAPAC